MSSFIWQLEEETLKLYDIIISEDKIELNSEDLLEPVIPIGNWVMRSGCRFWKRAFREFLATDSLFTKTKEFHAQNDTAKAVKRMIVRYFHFELLKKKAIDSAVKPLRFSTWVDISSKDCIFNLYQRKNFPTPHLQQCPWYLDLNPTERILDEEVAFKALCDRQTLDLMDAHGGVLEPPPDVPLTEKEKRKLALQLSKSLAKQEARKKAEVAKAEAAALRLKARVEKKLGKEPRRSVGSSAQSPASSANPSSTQITMGLTQLTLYPVDVELNADDHGDVEVIHDTHQGIFAKKDSLDGPERPLAIQQIDDFAAKHQGQKRRSYKMSTDNPSVVDLIVLDIPEGLPVPGIGAPGFIPEWNRLEKRISNPAKKNKMESPFIKDAFEFAEIWICDDGALLLFHPDSRFHNNEVAGWAAWANFKEAMKWTVVSGLPLTKPDYSEGETTKTFIAKVFIRCRSDDDQIPDSKFAFNDQEVFEERGVNLIKDGILYNGLHTGNLTMSARTGSPYRGARERTDNMMAALVDLLTESGDIILDLTASTGLFFLIDFCIFSQCILLFHAFWVSFAFLSSCLKFNSLLTSSFLGATLRAGRELGRHVIGLEGDYSLFTEVLLPLLPQPEIAEEEKDPSPVTKKRAPTPADSDDEDAIEVKRAPKRSCK